jgi:hypothetical protein
MSGMHHQMNARISVSYFRTIPILQWYSIVQPGSRKRRPILSTWQEHWESCNLSSQDLPLGWTRSSERNNIFTHESIPETEFRYPISLSGASTQTSILSSSPLITCRTQRAWLRFAERFDQYEQHYSLRDGNGTWAGMLHLHHSCLPISSLDTDPALENENLVELVAISRGFQPWFSTPARYGNGWIPIEAINNGFKVFESLEFVHFFNVLCIERKDGIAYRLALGRVLAEKWEAQDLQWIDLILG